MMNIRSFVHDVLPHNIQAFDKHNTLLEASFICEQLGLQGRVDMLQKDFKVLVEQKSGNGMNTTGVIRRIISSR